MGQAQVADDLPEGFEPDALPDGFDVDEPKTKPIDAHEHMGPEVLVNDEQQRYARPLLERAREAADRVRKYGMKSLSEDQRDALQSALNGGLERQPKPTIGMLEASNLGGYNGASLGANGAYNPEYKRRLEAARDQHPLVTGASELVGGALGGITGPISRVPAAIQGGVAGWNYSDGQSLPERLRQSGEGAILAAVLGRHIPGAAGAAAELGADMMSAGRRAFAGSASTAGQGMQKLAKLMGAKQTAANEVPQDYAAQAQTAAAHESGPGAEAAQKEAISENLAKNGGPDLELDPNHKPLKRQSVSRESQAAPEPELVPRRLTTEELRKTGPDPIFSPDSYENRSVAQRDPVADFFQNRAHNIDVPGQQSVVTNPTVQDIMRRVQGIDAKARASAPGFAEEPTQTMAAHMRPDFNAQQTMTKVRPHDPFADAPTEVTPPPESPPPSGGNTEGDTRNVRVGAKQEAAAEESANNAKQSTQPWDAETSDTSPGMPWEVEAGDAEMQAYPRAQEAEQGLRDLFNRQGMNMQPRTQGEAAEMRMRNAPMPADELDQAALSKLAGRDAPSPIDSRVQRIRDVQADKPEAVAAFGSQPPDPLRFGTKQNAWDKMKDAAGIDDYDAARGDAAYKAWKAGRGPKPDPFPGGQGFDEINSQLNRKPGRGVSGGLEAFEGLTRGRKTWDDINTAVRMIRKVPGMEKFDLPPDVQEKILQQRMAAEAGGDTSFNFGANVDPKAGQRGFIGGDLLAAMTGLSAGKWATKNIAAPMLNKAGRALENSAKQTLTADAAARYASRDPSILMSIARDQGAMGGTARAILQSLQQGNREDVKAKTLLLEMLPDFRSRFARGTDDQDRAGSAASAY